MRPGVPQGRRGMRRGVAGQASAVRASIMHAWEALAGGKCLPSAACMCYVLGPHSTSPKAAMNPLNLKSYNKLGVSLQGDSGGEMPQRGRGIVSRKENAVITDNLSSQPWLGIVTWHLVLW